MTRQDLPKTTLRQRHRLRTNATGYGGSNATGYRGSNATGYGGINATGYGGEGHAFPRLPTPSHALPRLPTPRDETEA